MRVVDDAQHLPVALLPAGGRGEADFSTASLPGKAEFVPVSSTPAITSLWCDTLHFTIGTRVTVPVPSAEAPSLRQSPTFMANTLDEVADAVGAALEVTGAAVHPASTTRSAAPSADFTTIRSP